MKRELSASMMCARLGDLGGEIQRLELAGIDSFHFDVMDGHFVPNLALSPDVIRALRPVTKLPFHVHLMVDTPEGYVGRLGEAGADLFLFHIEATRYPYDLVARIRSGGMRAGIALNPGTPVEHISGILHADAYLIMTVEPGFAGREWIPSSVERVQRLRRMLVASASAVIVDGHIDTQTAPQLRTAGATTFVCGTSALFRGDFDYGAEIRAMKTALRWEASSPRERTSRRRVLRRVRASR